MYSYFAPTFEREMDWGVGGKGIRVSQWMWCPIDVKENSKLFMGNCKEKNDIIIVFKQCKKC